MNDLFIGPFKKVLTEFYEYKINLGYVYSSEKENLKDFDKFTYEKYPKSTKISKEIAKGKDKIAGINIKFCKRKGIGYIMNLKNLLLRLNM